MKAKIYHIDSWFPWPLTTIIWGIHGNEPTWFEVVEFLRSHLEIDAGKVVLISAHQVARERNIRYVDKDLNRSFGIDEFAEFVEDTGNKTFESRLARSIMPYIDVSDYMIDIHNTVSNPSPRFCITEHSEFSQYLDVPYSLAWFSQTYVWSTDQYADRMWVKWFCLEAWWIWEEDDHTTFAINALTNFLKATWNIQWDPVVYQDVTNLHLKQMYVVKEQFRVHKAFDDFEQVKAWDTLGKDGNEVIVAKYDSYILFANNQDQKGRVGFMLLGRNIFF